MSDRCFSFRELCVFCTFWVCIWVCFFVLSCLFARTVAQDYELLKDIKSGKLTLTCNMNTGIRDIDPSLVVSIDSDTGTFIFSNGYAKACTYK